MKLDAYTLIEGIVSMVILSLLLSIAVLITFNLYRSFPSEKRLLMERRLSLELDSLLALRHTEEMTYTVDGYRITYTVEPFENLENSRVATCTLMDSTDMQLESKGIFYVEEE